MAEISQNSIVIQAPAAEVFEVLAAVSDYPSWSSAIKSAEVLERDGDGRATQAKLAIDAGVMKDRVTLDYDWSEAPGKITFSLDDADLLTEMTGAYIISDEGDDETKVIYELTVALSMPVPSMMRQKAERSTIDLALKELKKKLEG
jgi:ribosome-associated toxin RatA of RatAB toxin-antitoxin module